MKPDSPELRRRLHHLPAFSPAARSLLPELGRDELDMSRLLLAVGRDPGLTARLLRLANSPFFGLPGRVASLKDAGIVLGMRALRPLVLAAVLEDAVAGLDAGVWARSTALAAAARALAGQAGMNREAAYTVGLLHNLGALLVGHFLPLDWQALGGPVVATPEVLAMERARLGFDRCELAADIARDWHFPEAIQHALRHYVRTPQPEDTPLTLLLHLAHRLLGQPGTASDPDATLSASALGLSPEMLDMALAEAAQA